VEQWRITTTRAHVSGVSGVVRPPLAARVVALLMLVGAVGLGVLLLIPAFIVGALVVGCLAGVLAFRRAIARVFQHDGRRNVRVVARDE